MHADNRRGILAMSLAMAMFIANDALVKQVSASLPGPQLIFIRGVMATVLIAFMAQFMGHLQNWRLMRNRRLWLRGAIDAASSLTYLTALFHLPLGNATAINLASPLFITVFAIYFFKEHVSFQRGAFILLGFGGVLLVVQPASEGFNVYGIICVVATLLHATRDTLTRAIGLHIPVLLITLSTAISVALGAGAVTLTQSWVPVHTSEFLMLLLISVSTPSNSCADRDAITTLTPFSAKSFAVAAPMPRPPPVIIAVFPSRVFFIRVLVFFVSGATGYFPKYHRVNR